MKTTEITWINAVYQTDDRLVFATNAKTQARHQFGIKADNVESWVATAAASGRYSTIVAERP